MASRLFVQRTLTSTLSKASYENVLWAVPGLTLVGWILYPAMDEEFMIGLGLFPDPDADVNMVQAAKDARMALKFPNQASTAGGAAVVEEEEEEEEEASAEAEEEAASEEEEEEEAAADEAAADEEEEEAADEEEEEEEDEEKIEIKPLYLPTKGKHLDKEDIWDNFTIKAVRMNEDMDDDDEDEDEGETHILWTLCWPFLDFAVVTCLVLGYSHYAFALSL
jgi:flagellar biosynthesis GTPase FlhF